MGSVVINDSGLLLNEAGPKDNPREVEFFSHAVSHTITNATITGWSMSGDVPVGVSINSSGVISGTVAGFWEQPSCTDNKPREYIEVDCRNFPDKNGRFNPATYDFVFTTTVNWIGTDDNAPGSASASHVIKLVKDWNADHILMARSLLDGSDGREPYHCQFGGPTNQAQCEKIGGTWDESRQICSIAIPQDQASCEAVGGTWENSKCNMVLIKTQTECEAVGGVWTKNVIVKDGVTYDNSADYLSVVVPADRLSALSSVTN